MLKERSIDILEAGIRHYIETGEPVTSGVLFEAGDFGIKPAMIRAELCALGEAGYFTQNHPSGGRVPTEKAYRFFVERVLKHECENVAPRRVTSYAEQVARNLIQGDGRLFTEASARHLSLMGVGCNADGEHVYESGMYDLFSQLDILEREDILGIARDIERLNSHISTLAETLFADGEEMKFFIGENPITKSPRLSLIARRFTLKDDLFFFFLVGPTRMDYQKSFRFLQAINESMRQS